MGASLLAIGNRLALDQLAGGRSTHGRILIRCLLLLSWRIQACSPTLPMPRMQIMAGYSFFWASVQLTTIVGALPWHIA